MRALINRPFLYRGALYAVLCSTGAFAAVPDPGSPAPEFRLPSQSNGLTSLKAYKGRWVVLFFFGNHSSPEMSLYTHNLERDSPKYAALHAQIIGIGRTSPEDNRKWAREEKISFPLLSDTDQKIAAAYGVPHDASNSASDGIYEVIIDPTGTVRLPGVVTNDVDGQSEHLQACLQYEQRQRD